MTPDEPIDEGVGADGDAEGHHKGEDVLPGKRSAFQHQHALVDGQRWGPKENHRNYGTGPGHQPHQRWPQHDGTGRRALAVGNDPPGQVTVNLRTKRDMIGVRVVIGTVCVAIFVRFMTYIMIIVCFVKGRIENIMPS